MSTALAPRDYRDPQDIPHFVLAQKLAGFTAVKKAFDEGEGVVLTAPAVAPVAQKPATSVVVPMVPLKKEVIPKTQKAVVMSPTKGHVTEGSRMNPAPRQKHTHPAHIAPRDVPQKSAWKGNIPVWELFFDDQSVLVTRIWDLQRLKVDPAFAFYLEDADGLTGLKMSVTIQDDSVKLKAIAAVGKLSVRFPAGMMLSVEELRGTVLVYDPVHLYKVNEFRRVMDLLRFQLNSSHLRENIKAIHAT